MMRKPEKQHISKKKSLLLIFVIVIVFLAAAFIIYLSQYYHADESSYSSLVSDESVEVTQTDYGWFFDGPSDSDALIFYPGAKVEETAYAPLLHQLAEEGMDVCLVTMPFHLAVFAMDKAEQVMKRYEYDHWYIGGHSLGGAVAAIYASEHEAQLTGIILLAAYATKALDDNLLAISIYGSKDGVLKMEKLEEGRRYMPDRTKEYLIQGGNHAQFGNYGRQQGDGNADILAEEQQQKTIDFIMESVREQSSQ